MVPCHSTKSKISISAETYPVVKVRSPEGSRLVAEAPSDPLVGAHHHMVRSTDQGVDESITHECLGARGIVGLFDWKVSGTPGWWRRGDSNS